MIYYFTPYIKGNLGQAYNHYCELVDNDNDWITFMDGDTMQLNLNWGDIWENILNKNDDAGIITCMTNRIGCWVQRDDSMINNKDIISHKKRAMKLFDEHKYAVSDISYKCISGLFFSFKKSTWKSVGGFIDGILDVDIDFFNKVCNLNKKCYIAKGFYILHYYRLLEGVSYIDHLKIEGDKGE